MAPRKVSRGAASKSNGTPKKRVAANGFKLPDPIPEGQVITDMAKNVWVLGRSIGQGGFGEIYLASDDSTRPVNDTDKFVVKVEPHSNGPLFTEMHCYMRIAKPELIDSWKKEHKLKRMGMPKYLGSGSFTFKSQKYRFMVMERFGSDLQKILEKHNKKFSFKTVYQIGLEIIDVLEYIHDKGYIHADIKASNLLVGFQKGTENQVFLVDYGLACRYAVNGEHKEYKYDGRKAHDGTIEFTSRDAHIGAHSRRGDLEILGYNMTQWLCSQLPWEDNLTDCDYVAKNKRWYMDNVDKLMDKCFPDGTPPGLLEFLSYVASLTFDEKPDYEKCRDILRAGLVERGYKDDGKLVFMSATPKPASKKPKSRLNKVSTPQSRRKVQSQRAASPDLFDETDDDDMITSPAVSRRKSELSPAQHTPRASGSRLRKQPLILSRSPSVEKNPAPRKKLRKAVMRVETSKEESDSDFEHPAIDDLEKENNSCRATTRTRSGKPLAEVAISTSSGDPKPTKTKGAAAKPRATTVKTKTSSKTSLSSSAESVASLYDNPTPAMLELIAKKEAKALRKK
ncbi:Protein kinase domain [Trinorchestia longiramus]|nr:Protein kinase domain [Trinorchestia longiramus]